MFKGFMSWWRNRKKVSQEFHMEVTEWPEEPELPPRKINGLGIPEGYDLEPLAGYFYRKTEDGKTIWVKDCEVAEAMYPSEVPTDDQVLTDFEHLSSLLKGDQLDSISSFWARRCLRLHLKLQEKSTPRIRIRKWVIYGPEKTIRYIYSNYDQDLADKKAEEIGGWVFPVYEGGEVQQKMPELSFSSCQGEPLHSTGENLGPKYVTSWTDGVETRTWNDGTVEKWNELKDVWED